MDPFIVQLFTRMEELPEAEIHEIPDKSEPGDHVIGTLDDHHRRLNTVRYSLMLGHNALVDEMRQKVANGEASLLEIELRLQRSWQEYEVVNALFWLSLKRAYPEVIDKDCIVLREGFQVVWFDGKPEPAPVKPLWRKILGIFFPCWG